MAELTYYATQTLHWGGIDLVAGEVVDTSSWSAFQLPKALKQGIVVGTVGSSSGGTFADQYRGTWDNTIAYTAGQLVTLSTVLYLALEDSTGMDPSGPAPTTQVGGAEPVAAPATYLGDRAAQSFTINTDAIIGAVAVYASPIHLLQVGDKVNLANSAGVVLGSCTLTAVSAGGWNIYHLDNPQVLHAGTTYQIQVVSASTFVTDNNSFPIVLSGIVNALVGTVGYGAGFASPYPTGRLPFRLDILVAPWLPIAGG
jgi:hypothetical protein